MGQAIMIYIKTNHCSIMSMIWLLLFLQTVSLTWAKDFIDKEIEAEDGQFGTEEPAVWKELSYTLPDYPKKSDLQLFTIPNAPRGYHYAIDMKNLMITPDGVVHYTVVITSSGASQNIFAEGIDCQQQRFKQYAYGQQGDRWQRRNHPRWKSLQAIYGRALLYRKVLFQHYFCNELGIVYSLQSIKIRLQDNDDDDVEEFFLYE